MRLLQSKPDKEHPCKPGNRTSYILIIRTFSSVLACLSHSNYVPNSKADSDAGQIIAA